MVTTPEGSNKAVLTCCSIGVGIDFPVCTVGFAHGYSHSGPSGPGLSKGHTLIQEQLG